ncbi:hypothetical protein BaRGS_00024825 [Batillaria attramentaria]|uniref:Uncharacterized protein n=1 Tax=Batillaria attramentaria TaxID=370345 RepID=A0ABD0K9Z5_9CAEN
MLCSRCSDNNYLNCIHRHVCFFSQIGECRRLRWKRHGRSRQRIHEEASCLTYYCGLNSRDRAHVVDYKYIFIIVWDLKPASQHCPHSNLSVLCGRRLKTKVDVLSTDDFSWTVFITTFTLYRPHLSLLTTRQHSVCTSWPPVGETSHFVDT